MTNIVNYLPKFPLSKAETYHHISKIIQIKSNTVGVIFRKFFDTQKFNPEEPKQMLKISEGCIRLSKKLGDHFEIDTLNGEEVSFFQLIEYFYLKEYFPMADLSYLLKPKTYSFYHKSFPVVHDFFETMLSDGVCHKPIHININPIKNPVTNIKEFYTAQFESTARMSIIHIVLSRMTINSITTMKMSGIDLENLKGKKYESEEECIIRERRELDLAISIASKKHILSAMGGEIGNSTSTPDQFNDTL